MGMGLAEIIYLSEKGHIPQGGRILDIGSQNLYNAAPDAIERFVAKHGGIINADLRAEAERLHYYSTPRPGERTAYISELFDLTNIFYTSYDVCPALKTEIFDLNREVLPQHYRGSFDVVLNFGTTEHVLNQLNSFRVMHDAMKVGGVTYHQLPSTGWINHGYFAYHWTLFEDLIRANDYELLDWWYTPAGTASLDLSKQDFRDPFKPMERSSAAIPEHQRVLISCNINVVLRKKRDRPFAVGLELATSHSALSQEMAAIYGGPGGGLSFGDGAVAIQVRPGSLSTVPGRELLREVLRRIARRFR